jgi:hypothetical protein
MSKIDLCDGARGHISRDPSLKLVDDSLRGFPRREETMAVKSHLSKPFAACVEENPADWFIATFEIYLPFAVLLLEPERVHSCLSYAFR